MNSGIGVPGEASVDELPGLVRSAQAGDRPAFEQIVAALRAHPVAEFISHEMEV